MSDAFIPQLDGFYLNIVTTSDTYPQSLSIKEYPFSSKNAIESFGPKTRNVSINCIFGDDLPFSDGWSTYKARIPIYDNHINFIDLINRARIKPLIFTHPKYGEIEGYVETFAVDADDTQRFANITFTFVQLIKTEEVKFVQYPIVNQSKSWQGTNDAVTDDINAEEKASLSVAAFAGRMATFRGKLDAWLRKVTNPANSIINTVTYANDIAGDTIQSINEAVDRIVQAYIDIRNLPAQFINNIITGCRSLKASFTGIEAQYVHVMSASRVGYESGITYQQDDEKRTDVTKKENIKTFDAAGNYLGTPTYEEVMTIDELEKTLYDVREFINEAIQLDRTKRDLLDQARFLQDYINDIKLDRQRLETKENVPLQSLHTLTTLNDLSYQATERILRLNPTIKNPTFVDGEVKILV